MSEGGSVTGATSSSTSAGGILREARQAQGLHIAALAASIKVSQKKLEALEADRLDELPDATFTRALAQTVCRSLKIDPTPVLALLPQLTGHRLEQVAEGINAPFRDRPGRREPKDWANLASPAVWGPVLLLVAAAVIYLLPQGWLAGLPTLSPAAPAASAVSGTVSEALPPANVSETSTPAPADAVSAVVASATVIPPDLAASAAAAVVPLQLRTRAPSWVEVQDANSQVLISRHVQPGETVALDGPMPMRVKIGNAVATELVFRGQPLDLTASTRDNVARLELK